MRIKFNSSYKSGHSASISNQQRPNLPPKRSPPPPPPPTCEDACTKHGNAPIAEKSCIENHLLDFKKPILKLPFCTLYMEDILLLALILVLLNEECDEILLLALIYIFISGLEK